MQLAMVATIFLPLNFLCGVYGMNFVTVDGSVAIPLLNVGNGWWGYMFYWILCNVFILGLFVIFRQQGW